jgi:hypothetical protein
MFFPPNYRDAIFRDLGPDWSSFDEDFPGTNGGPGVRWDMFWDLWEDVYIEPDVEVGFLFGNWTRG